MEKVDNLIHCISQYDEDNSRTHSLFPLANHLVQESTYYSASYRHLVLSVPLFYQSI